jgi:hypothetical protein
LTISVLTSAVVARLEAAGYRRLRTPFMVASVRFDFTAVLQGSDGRSFDVILIVDTSVGEAGESGGERIRQRIEALSRALDISHSRLVLTAVLAGAPLPPNEVEAISRTCRVLTVEPLDLSSGGVPTEAAARDLDDRLRVLLPLQLDNESDSVADPIGELERSLPSTIDRRTVEVLLAASERSDYRAVSRTLAELLTEALEPGVPS